MPALVFSPPFERAAGGAVAPTSLAITGSATGVDGSPTTITGTLDAPATVPVTVTPTAAAGATFSTPAVIGIGQTSTTWTVTRATSGTAAIAATTSPALTVTGGYTYTSAASAWTFTDGSVLSAGRNTTTPLYTGVGAGWVTGIYPDPLPGQSLSVSGGTLSLVGDSTVPTVDPASSDALIAAIATADRAIEVMDSPYAVATNMRTGTSYGLGYVQSVAWGIANDSQDGDTWQISPGAIARTTTEVDGYLEGSVLKIWHSITVQGIPGRGRWSLFAPDVPYVDGASGIVVPEPSQSSGRKTIVVEDFDFSNWGRGGADYGVHMRSDGALAWTATHAAITFRRFKVGKLPYYGSGSGFSGGAETLVFERGHVYDCGGGAGSADGQEHNFYIGCRTLTMRGVRGSRSRANSADGVTDMDGHILKTSAVNSTIEGCCFDAGPKGDNSATLQFYAGGNHVVRGCLLLGSVMTQDGGTGLVRYEREASGVPWYYGTEGHSLTFERNLCISHIGKPVLFFRPSGSASYIDPATITFLCRDNIGMVAGLPTGLTPSPFTVDRWITNPHASWPAWLANNTQLAYGADEPHWTDDEKALKLYRGRAGTIAASGSLTTSRFLWPADYVARTDSYRGLA